jgi:hypothetical protein
MKCSKIKKILTAYLDDGLIVHEHKQVENHLKYCSLCRIELNALSKTGDMLDTWGDVQPSRDITSDVMAVIEMEQTEGSALGRAWQRFTTQRMQLARVAGIVLLFAALLLGMKETYRPSAGFGRAGMDQLFESRVPVNDAQSDVMGSRDSLLYHGVKMVDSLRRNYRRPNDDSDYVIHLYYDHETKTIQLIGYSSEGNQIVRPR